METSPNTHYSNLTLTEKARSPRERHTDAERQHASGFMPATVPFGAVKILQKRTGAEKDACKEALAASDLNEVAAVAYLAERNLLAEGSQAATAAAAAPPAGCADACSNNGCTHDAGASFISILRIDAGDGKTFPKIGDCLTMHYRGMLEDGTEFDSSVSHVSKQASTSLS